MEKIDELKTEELERRIAERIDQVKKIVNFIERLTNSEFGRLVSYSRGSANTHIVRRVDDFRDFSFIADVGQCMMGGNSFHVWYRPNNKAVFSVYYQANINESKILVFDPDTRWQDALNKMIDHQDETIAEAKKEKKNKEKQLEFQEEGRVKREKLLKRAEELRL